MAQSTCEHCGYHLQPSDAACPQCAGTGGESAQPPQRLPGTQALSPSAATSPQIADELKSADSRAIASLVLGIVNFMYCCVLCIPALILANQALETYERHGRTGQFHGLALAGRVLGWVGLGVLIVLAIGVPIFGVSIWAVSNAEVQATTARDLVTINTALDKARGDVGDPSACFTLEQLASRTPPDGVTNWRGPYLTQIPVRPYGGRYVYDTTAARYVSEPGC